MRAFLHLATLAAAASVLTACGGSTSATSPVTAATPTRTTSAAAPRTPRTSAVPSTPATSTAPATPTTPATSNRFVSAAALAACRSEVQTVTGAEDASNALDGHYVPLRDLVPTYLHSLPAYVGSWDLKAGKPVIGGGTSTKVAPAGCG